MVLKFEVSSNLAKMKRNIAEERNDVKIDASSLRLLEELKLMFEIRKENSDLSSYHFPINQMQMNLTPFENLLDVMSLKSKLVIRILNK